MRNPSGLCMCGCGRPTAPSAYTRRGYQKGEPVCYVRGHQARLVGPDYMVEDRGYETPCWIWQKSINTLWGYGIIWQSDTKTHRGAHRVYFERAHGSIPPDRDVHHRCSNPPCVNPDHLVALTRRDHMRVEGRAPYGNPWAKPQVEGTP